MTTYRLFSSHSVWNFCALLAASAFAIGGVALVTLGNRPGAAADSPPAFKPPPSEFECRWAGGPITIDGQADEEAWKSAQVIDNFYLPWLGKDARPARTATRARLLWDREYLYFFADMEDTDLYADVKEHDRMTGKNG